MSKIWNIAIYARVSSDKKEQAESIPTQIENLKKWILNKAKEDKSSLYNLIDIYEDKGLSGSTFERKAFIRMKEDIEKKKINMVLTRDLSRFSRNYILAGYYLEDYFMINNIRFVSVLDNVDTESDFNDIIPFKNILNEMYIKDCSKKVRSALTTRMEMGSSIASKPPYGYKFNEVYNNKQKKIILVPKDDETTEVVRKIFNLYSSGWGAGRIAKHLNENNIPSPSFYINGFKKDKKYLWSNNTIFSILKNPKYGGYMVQGRYKKISYKIKKVELVEKENWIYGGEFKGIVSKELFNKVQEIIEERQKINYRYKNGVIHPFSKVIYCGKCGKRMVYKNNYKGYKCSTSQRGGKLCTSHSVKEEKLVDIIYLDIKKMIDENIDKEKIYRDYMQLNINKNISKMLVEIERELDIMEKKIKLLYEDKVNGNINSYNFKSILNSFQQEQEDLLKRKQELNKQSDNLKVNINFKNNYEKQFKDLVEGKSIDNIMVETLVDKIIIEEDKKVKKINVFYKFKK